MILIDALYSVTGSTIVAGLILFSIFSMVEKKQRAVFISLGLSVIVAAVWFSVPQIYFSKTYEIIMMAVVVLFGFTFFLPIGKTLCTKLGFAAAKFDERDTVFAREEYQVGSIKYEKYYEAHPELKEMDDHLRKLPELLSEGGYYYNRDEAIHIKDIFSRIKEMTAKVDGDISDNKVEIRPDKITDDIKNRLIQQGAYEVGITKLNPMHVYSHVGRGPEEWGKEIVNNHEYAIIFSVEMDYYEVEKAPDLPTTVETARRYLQAAQISVSLADYIRSLGYPARAHISDSNYQIILPPLAVEAGLGEIGRHGYLISDKLGSRLRLGGVTTSLPLIVDSPKSFGVADFCQSCLKCADNCPPQAIPSGEKKTVRGVEKWMIDPVKCLHYWRVAGTDCGLCMKVCPYSHPPTLLHNIVRSGIKRSAIARKIAIWGDDLFYGRKVSFRN